MAAASDIVRVFGELDAEKIMAILAVRPMIRDLEIAAVWMSGGADTVVKLRPVAKLAASRVYEILISDHEGPGAA